MRIIFERSNSKTNFEETLTYKKHLKTNFVTCNGHGIKGYHEHQKVWIPFLQEEICGEMEPVNPVYKDVVAVKKNNVSVGHLLQPVVNFQKQ